MWFEAGVVALLVALGVVLVFRQFDRNNRSLEKVKRYGDRVMNTLSTFVEKKSSEIKDLAIEVQVSVKQGKELLRSVREVQEDLAARSRDLEERSVEIEAIRSRIDGYDTALAELVNMSERVDDNLRRLRGEDERLRRVDEQRTALQERLAGLDSTAASVEGRLRHVEDTAEKALSDKLTDFEQKFVAELRKRSEDLEARHSGWQAEMDQRIGSLQAEGSARTDEAAADLARALHDRTDDLQRRSSAEIERMSATVDGFDTQITQRFAALDAELTEMAGRLTIFTDQTPLLERADRMREHLERLDKRYADVQRQKHAVAEMEMELNRATKLGEEVSVRLARLSADRHRVESMERDFQRLLAIAEDMDIRLTTVETGRQAAQDVQAKLQKLGELADAVDARYQQLSHKHETAEATSSGVDRNFELLNQLDEQVIGLRPDVLKLAAGLAELQSRVDALANNKESADAVIRSLDGVDGLLGDLQSRTERLMTAREWLARAETRLEQIGQQARASVRELESLAGSRSEDNDGGGGSRPAVDNRETVSKLAGQGWSIPEIARATKLSRGEVELILEVEPATGVRSNG
ncbi:hypothetical protein GBAR_LOCUS10092 [Geodia barretti]|uniref:Uncharacterized protein n=1 Tax=Geodia barretti TaxID=519541 RepID=A0AA35WDD4_GEOBA|nr:hypothetical protein GBAR_LOCUS10092 [Geodia barretti]